MSALDRFAMLQREPIFIFGNAKAGTTAVAALLARISGETVALDLRREPRRFRYPAVRAGEVSVADFVRSNRYEFSRRIIKEPSLTHLSSSLLAEFPDARAAFVVRDPRDNVRSIMDRLGLSGRMQVVPDESDLPLGWKHVFRNAWLGLEDERHPIDALGDRWNSALAEYVANEPRIVLVRYEDFVADKVGVIADLARSLGLSPRHDIANMVDQQFQVQGQHRQMSWDEFYGENLGRLEDRCAMGMEELGYERSR